MDALTLLHEVSEAYGSLETLEVEAALIQESGDEYNHQRNERRVQFCYAAPDRMRYEPYGKRGTILQVADGKQLHTVHFTPRQLGGTRHYSVPVDSQSLPHRFNPKLPAVGEPFLFREIDEQVVSAEILRREDGCSVVTVEYQHPPDQGMMVNGSPAVFWVNAENRMVMRQEGKMGHRHPTEDEVTWSRHAMVVRQMRVNEPLAEETFQFTPPPDATLETGQGGGFSRGSGGGGFIQQGPDDQHRLEYRGSHEWQGETLVQHSKWKIRGMLLRFERRLTFSDDGAEVRVDEHVTGPKGEMDTTCKLPIA